MADINGGSLSFKADLDNESLNNKLDESIARMQGLSDVAVAGGQEMQNAFTQTANMIRGKIAEINRACETHEQAIADLQTKYDALGQKAATAFMSGRDAEYRQIQQEQQAIAGEIRTRQSLLSELREQGNVLESEIGKIEESATAANRNAEAHASMRARIRELKETLVEMEAAGQRGTAQYEQMQQEVARLTDAWSDAQAQANILANDQAGFQGVISGLNGMVGGFTAASSAVSLLAGQNENLQAAMLKVQQLMSITMGLQQVSEALNKDSAFRLVTLNGLKQWWNRLLAQSAAAQATETTAKKAAVVVEKQQAAATGAAATAQAAQNTAAKVGTAANLSLAGAFRMVGLAIKSIPGIGWIAAGITAIVAALTHFISKAEKAKKEAKEMYAAIADGSYKAIGGVELLSKKWAELGDNFSAKEKFVRENAKAFDDLGTAVNGVADAENLLVVNKDKFIAAQIAKAKAMAVLALNADKVKKMIELQQEVDKMSDRVTTYNAMPGIGGSSGGSYSSVANKAKQDKEKEIEQLKSEIQKGYTDAINAEREAGEMLKQAGVESAGEYAEGTLGAIQKAIQEKQRALANATSAEDYKKRMAEIKKLQEQEAKITGGKGDGKTQADTFTAGLEKMKAEYTRFYKWMNSGDDVLVNAAKQEFDGLLKQGATYMDYLRNQRDQIMSIDVSGRTKEQTRQLEALNNAIAEETRQSVLEAFNEELNTQLSNARTIIDQLNIIEQRRKELSNDGTQIDNEKGDILNNAETELKEQAAQEARALLDNYAGYVERKREMERAFQNDIALMERARVNATTDEERAAIDAAIERRRAQYSKDSALSGDEQYDSMLVEYRTFEEKRAAIAAEYAEKISVARQHGNDSMERQLEAEKAKEMLQLSFDELKMSPDYAEAFQDVENVSTQTLQSLIDRFEECKIAIGDALNPQDLAAYGERLNAIVDELNSRDPFSALKRGYRELRDAQNELKAAEKELARVRASGVGGDEEAAAIARVNRAKDKYIKANNNIKKSNSAIRSSCKQLAGEMEDLGQTIGGTAGEIISMIGEIANFTFGVMDGVEQASKQSAAAIKAVETASVILAVISAAMKIAQKLINLFGGDGGKADYERAQKVYQAYADTLDDVIDKQKELIEVLAGQDATQAFDRAVELVNKQTEAARELGKQYLNTGVTLFSHSNGWYQRDELSQKAWQQWVYFATQYGIAIEAADGRMTGLFNLSAEMLQKMKEEIPQFYAELDEDTREYIDDITDSISAMEEIKKTLQESLTGVEYESFEQNFIDMLTNMEMTTKEKAANIQEYLRKAVINQMFKTLFRDQLQEYYNMWTEFMSPDSAGGYDLVANEREALQRLQDTIISGASAAADRVNAAFGADNVIDESLTGAVQSVTEETASIVAGQMNAIRLNQIENGEIMRQQLVQMSAIATNTAYCRHLVKLDQIVNLLQSESSMRAQGLG